MTKDSKTKDIKEATIQFTFFDYKKYKEKKLNMILKTLTFQPNLVNYLCTVCITDNNGGKIALTIIISALVLLG